MNASSLRWMTGALVLGLFVTFAVGCVVRGGGYGGYGGGYGDNVDVVGGVGYYEPYGADYGGWGRGYQVGPVRGGDDRRHEVSGGRGFSGHGARGASGSRSAPSIPGGSHGR